MPKAQAIGVDVGLGDPSTDSGLGGQCGGWPGGGVRRFGAAGDLLADGKERGPLGDRRARHGGGARQDHRIGSDRASHWSIGATADAWDETGSAAGSA